MDITNCTELCAGGTKSRERSCTLLGAPIDLSNCTTGHNEIDIACNTHACPDPIPCPAGNDFVINNNVTCCKYYRRKYDPNVNPLEDGAMLEITDPPELCFDDEYIECPNVPLGSTCFTNPAGDGINHIFL